MTDRTKPDRTKPVIRVMLADDQTLIRAGFAALINAEDDLEVVGEAADGYEAVNVALQARADVILMDIRMPVLDGIEATRQITSNEDLVGLKVIILTTFELDTHVVEAIRAGASGFVGKGIEPSELLDAIRIVASGEALLSPRATQAMLAEFGRSQQSRQSQQRADAPREVSAILDVLTAREREVMALVAIGLSNDEIALRLYLSPLTAKTHVNRAMMKLNARDRAQLVVLAYQTGLAQL
jgi:DNA-binding NarL/FixJ family response regulator